MSDLIKRSDAINELEDMRGYRDEDGYVMIFKSDAIDRINCISSADRPRGHWIEQEDCWQCSECGDEYVLEVDVKPIDAKMHYCPNCGADMRGESDDR